jgi:hypothetical protein
MEVEPYKKKILADQLRTLRKLKKQNAKESIKEFYEQGCSIEKALHSGARALGTGANVIVESAKFPISFSLNFFKGLFNAGSVNEERYLLRSTIGKDLEKGGLIFRLLYADGYSRGGSHQDAKVALARKIASLALSLLKNNETYHDDWEERFCKEPGYYYADGKKAPLCDRRHKISMSEDDRMVRGVPRYLLRE